MNTILISLRNLPTDGQPGKTALDIALSAALLDQRAQLVLSGKAIDLLRQNADCAALQQRLLQCCENGLDDLFYLAEKPLVNTLVDARAISTATLRQLIEHSTVSLSF